MANKSGESLPTKTARELVKKFPNSPKLTLAKKLYKENPKLYDSIEHARGTINRLKGLAGRKNLIDKSLYQEPKFNYNPFNLPESKSEAREVWRLPKSISKVLLLSDIHFPYHDNEALTTALKYGQKENVDAIFINGDMIDFYQLSFHEKDPRVTSIADELEMARDFFDTLKKNFPKALIYYITGNHEHRLERYLRVKAPELLDVQEFRIDILLKLGEKGIHYLPHGTKCYFGKLLVEHGDKMKGSGGVNPARSLFAKLKRHAICGHFHRTSEATEKVYDSDVVVTYSTGCLCELEPRYMEVNNHNHGFAVVEMDGENFRVRNLKIVNGKVY
jgi:predicted phosphodiesterase